MVWIELHTATRATINATTSNGRSQNGNFAGCEKGEAERNCSARILTKTETLMAMRVREAR